MIKCSKSNTNAIGDTDCTCNFCHPAQRAEFMGVGVGCPSTKRKMFILGMTIKPFATTTKKPWNTLLFFAPTPYPQACSIADTGHDICCGQRNRTRESKAAPRLHFKDIVQSTSRFKPHTRAAWVACALALLSARGLDFLELNRSKWTM